MIRLRERIKSCGHAIYDFIIIVSKTGGIRENNRKEGPVLYLAI